MTTLLGKRIVVTRAEQQAGTLVEELIARGAQVIAMPTIAIEFVEDWAQADDALGRLDRFDWLVFTSANGVRAVWTRLDMLGLALPRSLRVAAVGAPTAQALAVHGVTDAVLPMSFRGDQLAAAIPGLAGKRVLLPQGDIARESTVASLEDAGALVEQVTVYRTLPAPIDPAHRAVFDRGVDAITFTSPSTVRNFALSIGPGAVAILRRLVVACIGPVTAEAVMALGLPAPLQAPEATAAGLVAALEARLA